MREVMTMRKTAWVGVTVIALVLSNWSLAVVAHSWGVPWALAYTVSAVFDGVALLCADLALQAARLGDSTFGPSACLILFAGASAWFNSWHAQLLSLPAAAAVFFAFPPVAAVAVTELQLRHDRRAALKEQGRIAEPLPPFGGATWFHHPKRAWGAQRSITGHRLHLKLAAATREHRPVVAGDGPSRRQVRRSSKRVAAMRSFDPELIRKAEAGIRDDLMHRPGEVSKRKSAVAYKISEYQAETIIKALRSELNGKLARV
jgi:hypothetical protein